MLQVSLIRWISDLIRQILITLNITEYRLLVLPLVLTDIRLPQVLAAGHLSLYPGPNCNHLWVLTADKQWVTFVNGRCTIRSQHIASWILYVKGSQAGKRQLFRTLRMARKDSPTRFGGKLSSFPQYRLEKPEFFDSTRLSKDILRRACCDKWFSVQKAGLDMLTAIISVIYARCKCRDQTDEAFWSFLAFQPFQLL